MPPNDDLVNYLLRTLGPDYDYGVFGRIAQSKDFGRLPPDAQKAITAIQRTGLTLRSLANPAGRDVIGQGAFPTPPSVAGPSISAKSIYDQMWALAGTLPAVGVIAQTGRAQYVSQTTGMSPRDALAEEQRRTFMALQEFAHQMTVGIVPAPQPSEEEAAAFNMITKPAAAVAAMGAQGAGVFKALSMFTKLPLAAPLMEFLPQRMADVGIGALTFGITDALRAEGVPDDPAAIDLSGKAAKGLTEMGVNPRVALLLSGTGVGGLLGAAFGGIQRGLQFIEVGQYNRLAQNPALAAEMRDALARMGMIVEPEQSTWRLANQYAKMLRKVTQKEGIAGMVGDIHAREEWIMQQLFGSAKIAPEPEQIRYLTGLLRGQPGAVSVATDITTPNAVKTAADKLGLTVDVEPIHVGTEDVVSYRGTQAGGRTIGYGSEGLGLYTTRNRKLAEYFAAGGSNPGLVEEIKFKGRARVLQIGSEEKLPMMDMDGFMDMLQPLSKDDTPWMRANKLAMREWITKEILPGYKDMYPDLNINHVIEDFRTRAVLMGSTPDMHAMAKYLTAVMKRQGYQVVEVGAGHQSGWHVILDPKLVIERRPFASTLSTPEANKAHLQDVYNFHRAREQTGSTLQGIDYALMPHDPFTPLTPNYDVLISRPNYEYPKFGDVSRQTKRATSVITNASREAAKNVLRKPTSEIILLADGNVVRGGLPTDVLATKLRVQSPVVGGTPRPDIGLKHISQMISMDVQEGDRLVISLPNRITQEQFDNLGTAINTRTWKEVVLQTPNETKTLATPFGQQVQDAVSGLIKPTKVSSRLTPELVSQFRHTGVFKGQAAVLANGTPVSVEAKAGALVDVFDRFTGQKIRVHPSKVTILPTSLEGELAPNNLFMQYLSPDEQQAFAKLRRGLQLGLDKPIEKFKDLAAFANSRGFIASQLGQGQIELARATDGDTMQFANIKAAAEYVRANIGPMPDLTPLEVKQALGGNANFGFIGGGGKPPEFGELMPIPGERFVKSMEDNLNGRGPGAMARMFVPTRGFVLDMDRRFGTTFFPVFENIQSRYVGKQNFETLWFYGKGGNLPKGILPLKKIMALAPDANQEVITLLLEGGSPVATKGEVQVATELRKWYNALFTEYGIEADYVERYAPHIRELTKKYGNPQQAFLNMANDPLYPQKGGQFWADNIRHGLLDVYDMEAYRVAARYLQQGANNRFMKEALDQAVEVVSRMGTQNQQLAMPLGYFLQAVRGYEFWDQRLAISESVQRMLESLPGVAPTSQVSDLAEKMANAWMGAVYGSTMGARPGLALRNIATGLMMTWPLYGGNKGRFIEAMTMALTTEGKNAAIADRAIAMKQGPALAGIMAEPVLGSTYDQIGQAAFHMYDSSDQYTRAVTYWAARMRAQDALDEFLAKASGASRPRLEELKAKLIKDSGLYIQDPQIVQEFFRRASTSPEGAARFAGKQASDVTNFLYGRGMQPRWMRSVGGRLLGQFGTWSLWYIDYLRRTGMNMVKNGYPTQAAAFYTKHALVNAAILYAGKEVLDVDLGRWAMYPSVFYSGGPGFQVAMGLSTLARGLGGVSTGEEDPLAPSRVMEGLRDVQYTLPAMIPFYFAGRDAVRFLEATDPTQRLAALLTTRPTREYDFQRKLDMILGKPVQAITTGNPYMDQWAEAQLQGLPTLPVDQIPEVVQGLAQRMSNQPGTAPAPQPAPIVPPASRGPLPSGGLPLGVPPGSVYRAPSEVRTPAESKPIPQY